MLLEEPHVAAGETFTAHGNGQKKSYKKTANVKFNISNQPHTKREDKLLVQPSELGERGRASEDHVAPRRTDGLFISNCEPEAELKRSKQMEGKPQLKPKISAR